MYILNFRTKSNGVPILSKIEIDNIAERCLMEFCPQTLETPQPIDEDRFITDYLGLTQDFKYLSHCGVYLGMIVFEDNKKISKATMISSSIKYKSNGMQYLLLKVIF